ncbi:hypothetical protein [Campylobacter jejuni]|uniref:hypothetical protein n=1 Tax=Campylobacter jejuni TaxID=197 RepID=UPI000772F9DC|nr:hypothetical protein [Campylobacter jejuni]EAH4639204.1 hypothetical protein [Campylobacter jejuni]EAH5332719.1 hypothetical protein [Campylobacter jejuni]EAH7148601.1 hypothetical protein [Campylobacter jejuni]EAH9306777.1 hypothetical protein [Campylobacter jejuni]EAJ0168420.1 hypothetical protein [Campylobacter jejuni]
MKKLVKIFLLLSVFAVSAFAYNSYDPYTCSLQNLIRPGSCKPNKVWNEEYNCNALPNIRVNGEPVCVDR